MWWLCTSAVYFWGRVCTSLLPPQSCSWVTYIWENHRVGTPEMQGMTVPGKIVLQIMGSHIHVSMPWLQGDEQDKFFSGSVLQSQLPNTELSYRRKTTPPPKASSCLRKAGGTAGVHPRSRSVTNHFTGCAADLPEAFLGQSIGEHSLFSYAVLWDKLAKGDTRFYLFDVYFCQVLS